MVDFPFLGVILYRHSLKSELHTSPFTLEIVGVGCSAGQIRDAPDIRYNSDIIRAVTLLKCSRTLWQNTDCNCGTNRKCSNIAMAEFHVNLQRSFIDMRVCKRILQCDDDDIDVQISLPS